MEFSQHWVMQLANIANEIKNILIEYILIMKIVSKFVKIIDCTY